jgi:hypothetical protein
VSATKYFSELLSHPFVSLFDLPLGQLFASQIQKARWKRALHGLKAALGDALG